MSLTMPGPYEESSRRSLMRALISLPWHSTKKTDNLRSNEHNASRLHFSLLHEKVQLLLRGEPSRQHGVTSETKGIC